MKITSVALLAAFLGVMGCGVSYEVGRRCVNNVQKVVQNEHCVKADRERHDNGRTVILTQIYLYHWWYGGNEGGLGTFVMGGGPLPAK